MPQIKLLCVSKLHGSLLVSTKLNMIFNIQPPPTFIFFVVHRNYLIKSFSSLEAPSAYKFHGPSISGVIFASTSEVYTSIIMELLKLCDYTVWHRGHVRWHDLLAEFHINLPIISKVIRKTNIRTDKQNGDLISLTFPSLRK
jgi:hypothetical protein